jgi:hypothetical protein
MRKALFSILIISSIKLLAQPTFTANNLNPVLGVTILSQELDTTGLNEGLAGPNQIWNFNVVFDMQIPSTTNSFITPSSAPISSLFPSTNIVSQSWTGVIPNTYSYIYINASNNGIDYLGATEQDSAGDVDTFRLLDPITVMKYPLSYQSVFYDTALTEIDSSTQFPFQIRVKRRYEADAYGTLSINGVSYGNALRLRIDDTTEILSSVLTGLSVQTQYQWYTFSTSSPVLTINVDNSLFGGNRTGTFSDNLTIGLFDQVKEGQVKLFPNPSKNKINIDNGFKQATSYIIKDYTNKTIVQGNLDMISKQIDIETLDNGVYILELSSNKKSLIKKFVKH